MTGDGTQGPQELMFLLSTLAETDASLYSKVCDEFDCSIHTVLQWGNGARPSPVVERALLQWLRGYRAGMH